MGASAASWDRIFEMNDRLACQFGEMLGTLTERGKDYKSALDAIARGRDALAEPLPAPRCDRPGARSRRADRAVSLLGEHMARSGQVAIRPIGMLVGE